MGPLRANTLVQVTADDQTGDRLAMPARRHLWVGLWVPSHRCTVPFSNRVAAAVAVVAVAAFDFHL